MDLSQIVTLVSDIVLAVFSGGLLIATVCLWRSTRRYANATEALSEATKLSTEATKEVAQSTKNYTMISERLLEMERLNFADRLFHHFRPTADHRYYANHFTVDETEVFDAYAVLARKVVDETVRELVAGDAK